MNALRNLSIAVLALLIVLLGLRFLVIRIEPGHVGVVNAEWTGGFIQEDYGPGYHLDMGPFHTWTVFDSTVQSLHMQGDREPTDEGTDALAVKSAEGATVKMDVTIKYRIKKGRVWRVMADHGPGQTLATGYKRKVKDNCLKILVDTLGSIDTDDFYDPEQRAGVQKRMEDSLRTALELLHVDLIAILIRDIGFQEDFEARIKEKALAEEAIELNVAETEAADFKGRTAKIESETRAKVVVIDQEREKELTTMKAENDRRVEAIRADFQKQVAQLRSDADLYAAVKQAEGARLLKEAEAAGQALRRKALSGAGGGNLVALELARNLNLGSLSVSTQAVNPLDIDALMTRLGAR
jgi:regulator of protease activity HflC (stomatin/prohibitin superfamily)